MNNGMSKKSFLIPVFSIILISIITLAGSYAGNFYGMKPGLALANDFTWPASWTLLGEDEHGPADGCPGGADDGSSFRDVIAAYFASDDQYLYLRLCTYAPAGWPLGPGQQIEQARFKWWLDINSDINYSGTSVSNAEYLLILEDLTDNTNDPDTTSRDQLGELTLMDDLDNGGFTARWDSTTPPVYAVSNVPETGTGVSPSPYWRRVLGAGTPGAGGYQGATADPDIGYAIDYDETGGCNYVDMYISWDVLGHPSSLCCVWATDINNNNLDQCPNCDRPDTYSCPEIEPSTPSVLLDKSYSLHIDINGNDLPDPGDTIRYTIIYENLSSTSLSDVYITDNYDETALTITAVTDNTRFTSHTDNTDAIRWPDGINTVTLNAGESGNVSYSATLNLSFPPGTSNIPNTAVIYSADADPVPDSAVLEVLVPSPPSPSSTPKVRATDAETVGIIVMPVNKIGLLMPLAVLVLLIIIWSGLKVVRRRTTRLK